MNELEVAAGIATGALTSPQRFGNSYLVAMRVSGTGLSERPSLQEKVFRDPKIWLSEETQARVCGLTVTLDHPASAVMTPDEYAQRAVGAIILPYVADRSGIQDPAGEDLWGVARLFLDEDMMASIAGKSTSPGVCFAKSDGNQRITLDDGSQCLVEGSPQDINHCAICVAGDGAGVWDKGSETERGLRLQLDNRRSVQVTEEEMAMDKARKDAAENIDKMLSGLDSVSKMCDALTKRLDALEANGRKESEETAEEKEAREAKERADAARKDLAGHRSNSMSAMQRDVALAEIQARFDAVSQAWGRQARRPMDGELPLAYRIRLLRDIQRHSVFKDADLRVVASDSAAFETIEKQIINDALVASRTPETGDDGVLVKRTRVDADSGHRVTEFFGSKTFITGLKRPSMRATAFLTPERRA